MRQFPFHSITIMGLALTIGCTASKQGESKIAGPVLDRAGIIPPKVEQRLDQELRDYNQRTGRALVVATTPSLGSESIESYSLALANRLEIGDPDVDNGLMLLVAPNERKVRIEVGLGLEKTVTNEIAAKIIRESIVPRFKRGDLVGGIDEGVDALIAITECRLADGVAPYCPEEAKR